MKLYRLDAVHEMDGGEFTQFFREADCAAAAAASHKLRGWLCDVYADEFQYIEADLAELLCGGPWPNRKAFNMLMYCYYPSAGTGRTVEEAAAGLAFIQDRHRKGAKSAKGAVCP